MQTSAVFALLLMECVHATLEPASASDVMWTSGKTQSLLIVIITLLTVWVLCVNVRKIYETK